MKAKRSLAVSLGLLALLFASACGGESETVPRSADKQEQASPEPTEAAPSSSPTEKEHGSDHGAVKKTVKAEIIDTDFRPLTITVQAGTKIVWTQVGDQPHSVSAADDSFDSSPDCGPLDSDKCLGMGDDFSFVFEKPGTYVYYCRVHGLPDGTGMVGEVVVK